jgi:cyclic pyranopterin monophosphate synthase
MIGITHKTSTLRKAIASAEVSVSRQETIRAIEQRKVPKGDIFEFSRAAALFAIKKTSDVIPDCHPLPIEFAAITYEVRELSVFISVEVHTVYKTGVEVEAMHGASVAALVMYDMLKPIDKQVEIRNIRLEEKRGGKSDRPLRPDNLRCAVVVCSDSRSAGETKDTAGLAAVELLKGYGLADIGYELVPDDTDRIRTVLRMLLDSNTDLIIFTGGTGLSPRDVTPEAIQPFIEREVPGIMETVRNYGQQRTKTAMLSRGIAGFAGNTLIITLPGSKKGVEESMQAIFPEILHVFHVRDNPGH